MKSWSVSAAWILLAWAGPVFAQSPGRQPAVFVDGAVLSEHLGAGIPVTSGGGLAAGVSISPRFSVRFEIDVAAWHVYEYANRYRRFDHIEALSVRDSYRTPSYSVMFAGHLKSWGPLQLALMGGVGAIDSKKRESSSVDLIDLNGRTIGHQDSGWQASRTLAAAAFGVDAAIAVTEHLAVVPRFRLHGRLIPGGDSSTGDSNVQPGVAVRWRF